MTKAALNASVRYVEQRDIAMFVSGLSRMALEARVGGKVGYTGGRDTVLLAADFDVNSFWCSHRRVRSTVGTLVFDSTHCTPKH